MKYTVLAQKNASLKIEKAICTFLWPNGPQTTGTRRKGKWKRENKHTQHNILNNIHLEKQIGIEFGNVLLMHFCLIWRQQTLESHLNQYLVWKKEFVCWFCHPFWWRWWLLTHPRANCWRIFIVYWPLSPIITNRNFSYLQNHNSQHEHKHQGQVSSLRIINNKNNNVDNKFQLRERFLRALPKCIQKRPAYIKRCTLEIFR